MSEANFNSRTIWTGDCLEIMRGMNSESVDLIYLDPPFNSNANYAAPIGSLAEGAGFKDVWTLSDVDVEWINLIATKHPRLERVLLAALTNSDKSYLAYMAARLLEMPRLLKTTGSIYLHCDPTMSHYLKLVMDTIFGRGNFKNEVIWHYRKWSTGKYTFQRNHDVILCYSRSDRNKSTFNQLFMERAESTIKRFGEAKIISGHDEDGNRLPSQTEDAKSEGVRQDDVWNIRRVPPIKQLYRTEKPVKLLNRIIRASSNEGDMVLDPFCGCATACVSAENLRRQWVGIDISPKAGELVLHRLASRENQVVRRNDIVLRTDIPQRTDIGPIPRPNSKLNQEKLYGQQAGYCAGCGVHFELRNLEVDHIIAKGKGGTDHIDNLQLLCGNCNRIKGVRGMAYLVTKLQLP